MIRSLTDMFTKQHYEAIAECLSQSITTDTIQADNIIKGLIELFKSDNPNFNEKKFLQSIWKGSDID